MLHLVGEKGGPDARPPNPLPSTQWRPDVLERLFARQTKQWKRGRGQTVAVICDDVFYDKQVFSSRIFREMMMNGR